MVIRRQAKGLTRRYRGSGEGNRVDLVCSDSAEDNSRESYREPGYMVGQVLIGNPEAARLAAQERRKNSGNKI